MQLQCTLPGFESALQPEKSYYVPRPERWLPIPDYEGLYSISDRGRIRSERNSKNSKIGRFLQRKCANNGYFMVSLTRNGTPTTYTVHRLVARAFLGEGFPGAVVNHRNADRLDNRATNLEWVTRQENIDHARRLGRLPTGEANWTHLHPEWVPRGEQRGNAKLTDTTAREARALAAAGHSVASLVCRFGVTDGTIRFLLKGITWRHLL